MPHRSLRFDRRLASPRPRQALPDLGPLILTFQLETMMQLQWLSDLNLGDLMAWSVALLAGAGGLTALVLALDAFLDTEAG